MWGMFSSAKRRPPSQEQLVPVALQVGAGSYFSCWKQQRFRPREDKRQEEQVSRVTADVLALTCRGGVSAGQGGPCPCPGCEPRRSGWQHLVEGADCTPRVEGGGLS